MTDTKRNFLSEGLDFYYYNYIFTGCEMHCQLPADGWISKPEQKYTVCPISQPNQSYLGEIQVDEAESEELQTDREAVEQPVDCDG